MQTLSWRIDALGAIIDVHGDWDAFAKANEADALTKPNVLGKSLWEYLGDDSLKTVYKALVDKALRDKRPVEFPFRCDSPELRRRMRMRITPDEAGGVLFDSRIESVEERDAKLHYIRISTGRRAFFFMCGLCNRVRRPTGRDWMEIEVALEKEEQACEYPLQICNQVCPDCGAKFKRLAE